MKQVDVNKRKELYSELREKFDEWNVARAHAPNAYPEWWLIVFYDEVADEFMGELAEIVAKYVKDDDEDDALGAAWILVNCELRSTCDYSRAIRNRMDKVELANYARDKFLNDLIDAAINEFGET